MSIRRVMDDLDSLLADLQSTSLGHNNAANNSSYQMEKDHCPNYQVVPSSSRPPVKLSDAMTCATPIYDPVTDAEGQPLYEPQFIRPMAPLPSSAAGGRPNPGSTLNQPSLQCHPMTASTARTASSGNKRVSTLSSNLSELDSLLAELSSAQFNVEVDRRTGGTLVSPTGGSTFGANKERSVDSLLNDLDNTPPIANSRNLAPGGGTSTATRDLDELMASLSGMTKISNQPSWTASPSVPDASHVHPQNPEVVGFSAPVHGNPASSVVGDASSNDAKNISLQEMMEKLDSDMTRQGVMTVPKGHCAACAKPIVGQVITALARLWHPEHFMCVHCREPIGTRNFFERDSQPYCERDYHLLFSPTCASCNGPIVDKCLTALDRTWHPEHFCCCHCRHQLSDAEGFHEKDGLVYCRRDYYELFAPRCGACSNPILDSFISALNKQWHPECFVCRECSMPFGAGNFFDHEGFPYCETHYHAARGSLCATCRKPIMGRCITAMYRKFHPEHFVCTFCQRQLNKGTFKEDGDKPYCHPCFVRLFS